MPRHWFFASQQVWIGSFKRGTKHSIWSRDCKNIRDQSSRWKKNLTGQLGSRYTAVSNLAELMIDLWYFCSLLIYYSAQYLIWKIYLISVWSQWAKDMVWLLVVISVGQSDPKTLHEMQIMLLVSIVCAFKILLFTSISLWFTCMYGRFLSFLCLNCSLVCPRVVTL